MDAARRRRSDGPGVLDALALVAAVADELVVRTVRDTHLAWVDRVHGLVGGPRRGGGSAAERLHRGIAGAVYAGLGGGLRAASAGLDRVAATGVGPRLDDDARGRFLGSAVNGLIGDRLAQERPRLAIQMAVRVDGRDVPLEAEALRDAFPDAAGRVVVLLHGLCEHEGHWQRGRERVGTTYPEMLRAVGWTPVLLRANTGLGLRANGVALCSLLQDLVDAWPVEVTRVALVGHSMGGLVMRVAAAVATGAEWSERPWTRLVTDVVTLGTPHLGAPLATGVGHGSRGLGRLPETAAFGRILDHRSLGVRDLVAGLAEDVPPLPHARYHLVAATLSRSSRHPLGQLLGDVLVRVDSAYGRDRAGGELFPGADVLHVGGAGHFDLLNHPAVHRALREWLA
ncbi:lipase family alpha/beta hydrolase [Nocardioides sp. GCM10027113]|uniref:lipase family alpha/beta hydrolase n=1 Tax=unclassified Nocardioides TaxID=2615069 RepID=UPI00360B4747